MRLGRAVTRSIPGLESSPTLVFYTQRKVVKPSALVFCERTGMGGRARAERGDVVGPRLGP